MTAAVVRSITAGAHVMMAAALMVAVLANGGAAYLKRVGWWDGHAYVMYFERNCHHVDRVALGRCCAKQAGLTPQEHGTRTRSETEFVYRTDSRAERALKLAKDVVVVGFIVMSLALAARGRAHILELRSNAALGFFTLACVVGFATALWQRGGGSALVGVRPFLFLVVAWLGAWSAGRLRPFALFAGLAMLAQVILVPYELAVGMPMRLCPNPLRAAGTLVLPNSLGVFAVAAFAFAKPFIRSRAVEGALLAAAALVVVATGSATSVLAVGILLFIFLWEGTRVLRRPLAFALPVAALALAASLPLMTGRAELLDSVGAAGGRMAALADIWRSSGPLELTFGHGLDYASNLAKNLGELRPQTPDSSAIALLGQVGLLGMAAFYAVLGAAFARDSSLRPFYGVVAMCSLTINVIELFPVNFLLGLAWASSLSPRPASQAYTLDS